MRYLYSKGDGEWMMVILESRDAFGLDFFFNAFFFDLPNNSNTSIGAI